jgi:PAS domain-containing protein
VNAALARLLRRPAAALLGHPFLNYIHPGQRPAALAGYFEAVVAAAAGIRHGDCRLRCLTGDGGAIPLRARWTVLDPDGDGSLVGVVYLTADAAPRRPRPTPGG